MKQLEDYVLKYFSTFFDNKEEKQNAYNNNKKIDPNKTIKTKDWEKIVKSYKQLLPYSNLEEYNMEIGESGSFFIHKLFDKYVDNDTFVISTYEEHDTTQIHLSKIKNKMIIGVHEEIKKLNIDKIYSEFKKSGCKKIFLYIVGTSLTSGQIASQLFFYKLKEKLINKNIEHIFVLDDVHGMFITPRDYSVFDAILYTAHSWVKNFEMGLLFHKLDNCFGLYDYEYAKIYLEKLKIFISKFEKVRQFKTIMIQYFAEELSKPETFEIYDNTTQHIFTLQTHDLSFTQRDYDELEKYYIKVSEFNIKNNFVRIRFQELISLDPLTALEGLKKVKKILKRSEIIKNSSLVYPTFDGSRHIVTDYKYDNSEQTPNKRD